jgi:hypothetical protein
MSDKKIEMSGRKFGEPNPKVWSSEIPFVSQHNGVWLTMILLGSSVCNCMLYVAFYKSIQIFFIFWILDLKFGTHLQEPIAPRLFLDLAP